MWGDTGKQDYYMQGRKITDISRDQIDGICECGNITLKSNGDFENHNGGLTVRRSNVDIYDENGEIVQRLRPRNKGLEFNRYCCCNACVNDWK
jgi:hypothetical protein